MFVDLQDVIRLLPNLPAPTVGIASVGGRPVGDGWIPTKEEVRQIIFSAIGQGSLLTFNNVKGRSRQYFAEKALTDGHLWALKSFTLSISFASIPRTFREALAYCGHFHMSWQENDKLPIAVLATGDLKAWSKYVAHKDDPAFNPEHRKILKATYTILHDLLPEVYK